MAAASQLCQWWTLCSDAERGGRQSVKCDAVAFEEMYRTRHAHVLTYCGRRLRWHDALEATDEVFLIAWRRCSDVPTPPADLFWLYGVARGVVANHTRGDQRRRRLLGRLQGGGQPVRNAPSPHTESWEHEVVGRALARLREDDQEVLRLAAWEELAASEIAVALDVSPETARQRLHRARQRLARELEPGNRHLTARRSRRA